MNNYHNSIIYENYKKNLYKSNVNLILRERIIINNIYIYNLWFFYY